MKRARNALISALAVTFAITAAPAHAASERAGMSELEVGESGWSGYLKSYAIGIFPNQVEGGPSSDPGRQLLNAVRLNGFWRPYENLKVELGYEFQPILQSGSAATQEGAAGALGSALPLERGASYRVADLNTELAGSAGDRDYRLYQNLDRVAAYWNVNQADITIGRQAITFGSARVIQTTDVLLPYSFQQLSIEYRIGVDAVRAQIPISQMGELDLGVVVGENARTDESAAFARIKTSFAETDIVGMVMAFSGARLLGGGIERGIWQLGYSLDFAHVRADGDEQYFRLSQALDYTFPSDLMLFAEYHYNGAGANDPSGYIGRLDRFAYRRGGVFLLGKRYFIPGLAYPVTPLLGSRIQVIKNLDDRSVFISGGLEYSFSENVYLDLGLFGALGRSPRQEGENISLASEFGSYPNRVYGAVRWYF